MSATSAHCHANAACALQMLSMHENAIQIDHNRVVVCYHAYVQLHRVLSRPAGNIQEDTILGTAGEEGTGRCKAPSQRRSIPCIDFRCQHDNAHRYLGRVLSICQHRADSACLYCSAGTKTRELYPHAYLQPTQADVPQHAAGPLQPPKGAHKARAGQPVALLAGESCTGEAMPSHKSQWPAVLQNSSGIVLQRQQTVQQW